MQHTQVQSAFEQAEQSVRRAEASKAQAMSAVSASKSRLESARRRRRGGPGRGSDGGSGAAISTGAGSSRRARRRAPDVQKAQAALESAQANLTQVQKTSDLQVANSQAAVTQAESTAKLARRTSTRLESLLAKGFISAQAVDTQRTQSEGRGRAGEDGAGDAEDDAEKVAADLAAAQSQ